MKIKGQYSTFSFRPPGVLKSSVSTSPRPRVKPVPIMKNQQMTQLAQGIDPKNERPLESFNDIPAGMLFFCNLENVYFMIQDGVDGIIITDDFHAITESLYYSNDADFLSKDLPDLQNIELLDEVFISFDAQWMQYNHWMGYCLSKAYLASLYTPESIKIVIPEYRQETSITNPISEDLYETTLKKCGFQNRVLRLKDGIYKARKLSYFWPNNYLPHAYFNFNDAKAFFTHLNKNIRYNGALPPRFFINQDPQAKPILSTENNDIIQSTLRNLNIPSITLNDFNFDEQMSLFSQAELIVSPYRHELMNISFCQADTEVLEFTRAINKKNYLPAWPYMIASTNRLQYGFFDLDWETLSEEKITTAINKLDSI